MQTSVHIVTPSNVRILLRRKGKVSLTPKRNTESIEIEKWLKKEIAGDLVQAKRCCLSTARSVKARIRIYMYSQFQLRLN